MSVIPVQKIFAGNLKRARSRRRISQNTLAGRAGITTGYLAEIETCRKFPSAEVIQNLADGLRCHPSILFAPLSDETWEDASYGPSPEYQLLQQEIMELSERFGKEIQDLLLRVMHQYSQTDFQDE